MTLRPIAPHEVGVMGDKRRLANRPSRILSCPPPCIRQRGVSRYRPVRGSRRYRGRGWGSGPIQASRASAQIHVFVIRDISNPTRQTGERDFFHVEPRTRSDAFLRHASCGAGAAPSLARVIATLGSRNRHVANPITHADPAFACIG
jgi:hypothetical protein